MMGEGLLLFNGENLPEITRALMSFVSESCTRYMYLNLFLQNQEHFCFTFQISSTLPFWKIHCISLNRSLIRFDLIVFKIYLFGNK